MLPTGMLAALVWTLRPGAWRLAASWMSLLLVAMLLTLASAFGIPGQHITRKDQVEAALDTMLSSQGPYLLHVSIDELENVWPLVPPGASNAEMLEKLS